LHSVSDASMDSPAFRTRISQKSGTPGDERSSKRHALRVGRASFEDAGGGMWADANPGLHAGGRRGSPKDNSDDMEGLDKDPGAGEGQTLRKSEREVIGSRLHSLPAPSPTVSSAQSIRRTLDSGDISAACATAVFTMRARTPPTGQTSWTTAGVTLLQRSGRGRKLGLRHCLHPPLPTHPSSQPPNQASLPCCQSLPPLISTRR